MVETIQNALTVDVEDYFQVSALEHLFPREQWDQVECRIERNMQRILDLFARYDVKATFFMLGWIAQRYPAMVRRLVEEGHELASHGFQHIRVTQQSREDFRQDIIRTKALLEEISGQPVRGYRAASYSIGASNLWALDELRVAGYQYSSSIYPIVHDLYGMPEAPRFAFHPNDDEFLEVPVTTVTLGGKKFPCGGGGYFRLFPYWLSKWAMNRVNQKDQQACIFYFHPWEFDPQQPRQSNISLKTRVRHYLNLHRMESRVERLLKDFRWQRMDEIFLAGQRKS